MERKCEVKGKTPRITHNSVSPVWVYPYKKKEKKKLETSDEMSEWPVTIKA